MTNQEALKQRIADIISDFAKRTLKGEMIPSLDVADQIIAVFPEWAKEAGYEKQGKCGVPKHPTDYKVGGWHFCRGTPEKPHTQLTVQNGTLCPKCGKG